MLSKLLLNLICCLFLICTVQGQDIEYIKSKREADAFFTMDDHHNAIPALLKMTKSDYSKRIDFFFVAISYSKIGKKQEAIQYMNMALEQGLYFRDTAQITINKYLNEFRNYENWEDVKKALVDNYMEQEEGNKVTDHILLAELLRRKSLDQKFRSNMIKNAKEKVEEQEKIDRDNTAWLDSVISTSGWPGFSRVGKDGDHAAWLILQHADFNVEIQKKHLKVLQIEAGKENTSSSNVAYLTDRVLVNTGKKQLYGTQFKIEKNKENYPINIEPKELAYPDYVNDYRKYMGMSTVEVYLKNSLEHYQKKYIQ